MSNIFPERGPTDKKSSGLLSFILQFVIVSILFFAIGFTLGQKKLELTKRDFVPKVTFENQLPPAEQKIDFSLFWQVLESLPQKYVDKSAIDGNKLLYGAISGMVRSLGDPYTAFLDPKQNEAVRSELSGSYEGVGIQIGFNKEKRLVVIAPISGTPAAKSGLRARDLILKIDETETFDLTLPEAVDLIRGPAGTGVKLQLQHEGGDKPYEVEIEREKITVKSVEVEYRQKGSNKIAILKVVRFGETTDREWDLAVNNIQIEKARGVIVDMRNNPGGLLSSSVHLASEFTGGTIVKQKFSDSHVESLNSDHAGELLKIPLVILVNGGSASASEIFAGAIQDKGRGKVVGEQTFGKGTVQDAIEFSGGSGLHVTIAQWLTPKGASINGVGITPDVLVETNPDDEVSGVDLQLDRAIELIKL